jgi:hypothetical protein
MEKKPKAMKKQFNMKEEKAAKKTTAPCGMAPKDMKKKSKSAK